LNSRRIDQFGRDDLAELIQDATRIAIADQVDAGLDVISDGEQTGWISASRSTDIWKVASNLRLHGDSGRKRTISGKHEVTGEIRAPRGWVVLREYKPSLRD
jgi:5-methyltetrahydropteroyltriglutamate--homocysteine methyltransferase